MKGYLAISKMILYRGLQRFVDDGSLVQSVRIATDHENNKELPPMLVKTGLDIAAIVSGTMKKV